ncbi:MAG TPA: alpha/beta fold hydrolase, partial [Bryobacteraceae bacterium]|nr:alpha/beta fold hydrolase [Bryobacteraceae bacterium]
MLRTDAAHEVTHVEFNADGTTLRGWLYRPPGRAAAAPAVVMAHGYNCIKELYLDRYAAAIADAGHVVLAYDHRNFGESDGEPRQELDPWMQVRDYRNAITFVQTLDGVDPQRIGIWGTSNAGGHVLVVAAVDRRVRCVVAQVPTISGWQTTLRRIAPQALPGQRDAWDADRRER